jgi:hypothetical protein
MICGEIFETGDSMLDENMRKRFMQHLITGVDICLIHRKTDADGLIAFIGVDRAKSKLNKGGHIMPGNEHRTGRVVLYKREAARRLPNVPHDCIDLPFAFVTDKFLADLSDQAGSEDKL